MATEKLSWMFQLYDRMSGPADRIAEKLRYVERSTGRSRDAMGRFIAGTGATGSAISLLRGGLAGLAAYGFGKLVFGVGEAAASMLSFKESTMASLEIMTGGKKQAKEFFDQAMRFAELTPFQPEEVVDSFKRILSSGFKQEEVPVLFQAVGDIAGLSGAGGEGMKSLVRALGQVKGRGALLTEELNQITEVSGGAGIGRPELFAALAKNMGVEASKIPDMLEKGLIDADTAIYSFVQATSQRMGGLGQGLIKQSETLGGKWSNVTGAITQLFLGIPDDKLTGVAVLKGLMDDIIAAFSKGSGTATGLQDVMATVFNVVAQGLRDIWDGALLFWEIVKPAFEAFQAEFAGAAEGMPSFRDVIGFVASALGAMVSAIFMAITGISQLITFLENFDEFLYDIGVWMIRGLVAGIASMRDAVVDGVTGLASDAVYAFKSMLGINSPSRVFQELGMQTGRGFDVGLHGSFEDIDSPVGAFIKGETGNAGPGGAGARRGGPVTVNLTVNVDAQGNDAEGIARKLRDLLPGHLASMLEGLAIEGGVA